MAGRAHWVTAAWIGASLILSGCADMLPAPQVTPSQNGSARPAARVAPAPIAPISPQSEALRVFYRQMQNDQLVRGLLRTDGGGPDTPFTSSMLTQNFMAIAFFDEYSTTANGLRADRTATPLRRWEKPIRMSVVTTPGPDSAEAARNRAEVSDFAARLSRLTDVPIAQTTIAPNFTVLFLDEDSRLGLADQLRSLLPSIDEASLRYAINLPRDELCLVIASFDSSGTRYDRAVAILRAEHPDLMRQSCIHEELAQGMGLANDSPRARPSIFNDDEEFGYLTSQDELMLKMLYDPRLRPGMTATEAEPIVRQIAADLLDANS